ncbi:hypothetical protein CHGG_09938 [Chaetomium globosum CBS 148.51]|uniref:Uncharacterized protein n=1 Tax=Chaetomium globosum (strain ATCC 6205 / CBS 148.51 / DSM 1962 / NBRC 6347 / NRRL 1970) TaxID=306901 RepID=Q2GQ16_CHAGB|nr:uncharacterized protein CHGG_09938 [Chaetomium globosum CBS 148.51]EAQ83534.1 hypothetical protein CHGG_09938 [Chaetomium globosum CBS 148.51]
MCTYDYTPYTGCEDGPQHYYIQWLKCSIAVEQGRYCSMDTSSKVEQLRKLSANVLSCPLHGPIAVQQFVLEPANQQQPVDDDEPRRSRARSSARRSATSRGRGPRAAGSDRDLEQPARRPVRKQRSRREMVPESSDSESSSSFSARSKVPNRGKRMGDREAMGRRRSRTPQATSHQRSISVDLAPPPPLPLSMRHGRSEVSLPLRTDFEGQGEDQQGSLAGRSQSRPKNSLDIPRAVGVVGLPSSPDMHHRGSVHRSRSDAGLAASIDLLPELPTQKGAMSPASDSSPDQNPDMPFSTPGRRGRRTVARSVRDRSVDTTMRRIDEHVAQDPETQSSTTTTSPEPQHPTTQYPAPTTNPHIPHHRRSNSRPQLNTLQIPKNREPYQRDAYSAPTATPPETEITQHHPNHSIPRTRARSLRHISDTSPVSPTTLLPPPQLPRPTRSETSTTRHRAPAAKRPSSAARAPAASRTRSPRAASRVARSASTSHSRPREYLKRASYANGSWTTVGGVSSVASAVGAGEVSAAGSGKGGRNTLHKAPPVSMAQTQTQAQGQGLGLMQQQQQQQSKRPVPAPLNLQQHGGAGAGAGLPPCALPVSLVSPGFQSDADSSTGGKGAKATLLQRMGLRRKFSGLVMWDKDRGGREVGVEG